MNVLIIGGTKFIGPHITDALLEGGHSVTHFNRGVTSPPQGRGGSIPRHDTVVPHYDTKDIETVHGDRKTDLERLGNRSWDAVIDTCGFTPDVVEISARYLRDRTDRYLFVSTISVYDESQNTGPDEDAPLHVLPAGADRTEFNVEYYGALKALCEAAVRRTYGESATILRPGLIAGPYDATDRFTYWPVRFDAGGDVLMPVSPKEPVQYIDARDLAAFAVHALGRGFAGTYNCVTQRGSLQFGDLVDACNAAANAKSHPVWVDAQFLSDHEVSPWSDLPMWIPEGDPHRGVTSADSSRALAQGLRVRPLADTVRDTLAWATAAQKRLGTLAAGLDPARETALLREHQEPLTGAVK